jgi:hypothetical protein
MKAEIDFHDLYFFCINRHVVCVAFFFQGTKRVKQMNDKREKERDMVLHLTL